MPVNEENGLPSFGRDLVIVFVAMAALSLAVTGGTVFSYLAILAASGLRNVYLGWLGSGPLFYSVAGLFFLLQAVVVAAAVHLVRRLFRRI